MAAAEGAPTATGKLDRSGPPGKKRLAIVLSVIGYIIAGVPFWWKLTEVYRAPLPFGDVEAFAKQVSSSGLALPCQLQLVLLPRGFPSSSDRHAWSLRLQKLLLNMRQQARNLDDCHLEWSVTLDDRDLCIHQSGGNSTLWQCGYSTDELGADEHVTDESLRGHLLHSQAGEYTIMVFLDDKFAGAGVEVVAGKYRHAWITCPYSFLDDPEFAVLVSETATFLLRGGKSEQGKVEPMPLAADGSAIVSFSLLNANPENWIYDWDFHQIEWRYLSALVDMLRPVARLNVESQVLYYTPSAAKSKWNAAARSYIVDSKEVSFFVNANDWHVDTSTAAAGRSKVLHFAIYIPDMTECPLHIKLPGGRISPTGGFVSPSWGGVVIWNPPGCLGPHNNTLVHRLSANDLQSTMEVVVAQLRTLFGLSPTPAQKKKPKISSIPNTKMGFSEWEVDALLRNRVIADVNSTASTLASLLRLVNSLPNMVIQEEIGVLVTASVKSAKEAINLQSFSFTEVSEAASKARAWAETAFFHPSIMSLLHFPKEHHFAIYTPFFVPVLLHTFVSVAKETRRYFQQRRLFLASVNSHRG